MMNAKVTLGLAILGCFLSTSSALLETISFLGAGSGTAITGTGIGATTGSTVFLTATGATVLGGAVLLKGLALAAVAAEQARRGKREAIETVDETEFAVAALAINEPAQCYRRLICDLATGAMPKSGNDVILSLFDKPTPITSSKFDFATAASLGKELKSVQVCELRYSCPLSGEQIEKLFN